ncbi:MAG: type II toxin-antitoxin system RelE family toxin [Pirellulaceae bacterium]
MSRYTVYVLPDEFRRIKRLPGNVRQRVKNVIDELAEDPRPTQSKKLDVTGPEDPARDIRRLRLDNWRIVYVISEHEKAVDVIAVRKRPPYDYGDLGELLGE